MSKFLVVILLCCVSQRAISQLTLSGIVRDSLSGSPIPGAGIYIHDIKKGTVTDVNGVYFFNNLPGGKFLIEYTSIGFTPIVKRVDVTRTASLNVSMGNAVTEL